MKFLRLVITICTFVTLSFTQNENYVNFTATYKEDCISFAWETNIATNYYNFINLMCNKLVNDKWVSIINKTVNRSLNQMNFLLIVNKSESGSLYECSCRIPKWCIPGLSVCSHEESQKVNVSLGNFKNDFS
jgi:hypothetical protein